MGQPHRTPSVPGRAGTRTGTTSSGSGRRRTRPEGCKVEIIEGIVTVSRDRRPGTTTRRRRCSSAGSTPSSRRTGGSTRGSLSRSLADERALHAPISSSSRAPIAAGRGRTASRAGHGAARRRDRRRWPTPTTTASARRRGTRRPAWSCSCCSTPGTPAAPPPPVRRGHAFAVRLGERHDQPAGLCGAAPHLVGLRLRSHDGQRPDRGAQRVGDRHSPDDSASPHESKRGPAGPPTSRSGVRATLGDTTRSPAAPPR